MSHFITVVLVPEDVEITSHVEEIMAPFSEEIQVAPYEEPCYCTNYNAAHKEATEHANAAAEKAAESSLDGLRKSFREQPEGSEVKWEDYCKVYFDTRDQAEKDFLSQRDDRDAPQPDCDDCDGTGTRVSTYNPQSHWDWFVIGGRWDGWIQEAERRDDKGGFNFGAEHHQSCHNSVKSSEYLASIRKDSNRTPFALVDPKGLWHESGKMGWFGCSSDNKEEKKWADEIIALLEKYPDTIAVAVDCHI